MEEEEGRKKKEGKGRKKGVGKETTYIGKAKTFILIKHEDLWAFRSLLHNYSTVSLSQGTATFSSGKFTDQ